MGPLLALSAAERLGFGLDQSDRGQRHWLNCGLSFRTHCQLRAARQCLGDAGVFFTGNANGGGLLGSYALGARGGDAVGDGLGGLP